MAAMHTQVNVPSASPRIAARKRFTCLPLYATRGNIEWLSVLGYVSLASDGPPKTQEPLSVRACCNRGRSSVVLSLWYLMLLIRQQFSFRNCQR